MENLVNYNCFYHHPFGEAPWPCLNVVADHYKKDVIYKCEILTQYDKPIGKFTCDCGNIYYRKGPDEKNDDRYKCGPMKKYGHVWDAVLKEKIISGRYSKKQISRDMMCDYSTIINHGFKLGLGEYMNTKYKIKENKQKKGSVKYGLEERYKKNIEDLIANEPNIGRYKISKLLTNQYIWLTKNKREWINNVMPQPFSKNTIGSYRHISVDWNQRDMEMCSKVQGVINEIKKESKLTRITISYFARKIDYSALLMNLEKLPLTKELIYSRIENIDEFYIRKVDSSIDKLKSENKLKKWIIIRYCGLYNRSQIVDNYINQVLEIQNV